MTRESIYKRYVPALEPERLDSGPAYWFVFNSGKLLLSSDGGRSSVPFVSNLKEMGLDPIRTQYLGKLGEYPCRSAEVSSGAVAPERTSFVELRSTFDLIDEDLFLLAGRALQIVAWDQTTQYCGRCGRSTELVQGERAKKCPSCGFLTYPRLSPAVITAVVKNDKILLARRSVGRGNLHSVLAGFVEPGETLEECLKREVMEEVGIRVKNLRYFSSQPWPFPNSLMIGFTAEYESGEISVDGTEVSAAGWYDADDLPEIPPKMTIARDLIDWFLQRSHAR